MGRSFPSAIARHQTLDYARPNPIAPVTAEYSTVISVAYTVDQGNREVDHLAIGFERRNDGTTATAQSTGCTLRLVEPELTLVRRGDGPDPRMVELVRLLARRAAQEVYEEQMKERRPPRS